MNIYLVISISASNAEEKTVNNNKNKNHISLFERLAKNRPLHALMGIMGNQGIFPKSKAIKHTFFFIFPFRFHIILKIKHILQMEKPLFLCFIG